MIRWWGQARVAVRWSDWMQYADPHVGPQKPKAAEQAVLLPGDGLSHHMREFLQERGDPCNI